MPTLSPDLDHAYRRDGFVLRLEQSYPDLEPEFAPLWRRCAEFTETSPARMYGLFRGVRHVVQEGIPGDVVECGVWRGGSSMLAALSLAASGDDERRLYLYDTFEGMSAPTEEDVDVFGLRMTDVWDDVREDRTNRLVAFASFEEVRRNMASTGFPDERIAYVRGKVEETIPDASPSAIAVLRLDTDWYESTSHELEHLYPLLSPGGVLILDDYGYFAGARKAVDEYFEGLSPSPFLVRLDHTGRIAVKPA